MSLANTYPDLHAFIPEWPPPVTGWAKIPHRFCGSSEGLYFSRLFPVMYPDQELAFPILDVPQVIIENCGVRFKEAS